MNRSFKSVFNRRTGIWQVVSEKTRNAGKTGSAVSLSILALALGLVGAVPAAHAQEQFWDGTQNTADGTINGGAGTWNACDTNWTDSTGATNGTWSGTSAVFMGTGGNVTVDGIQDVAGLSFSGSGYRLTGSGSLNLINSSVSFDVSSGTTIDVSLVGNGKLVKSGLGSLILNGMNRYTGGTLLSGGTLIVSSESALGSGALTAAGGIFNNTVSASLNNAVHLLGTLTLTGAQSLALNGVIDGTGNLAKTGTGNLLLTGNNTYTGNTFLLGGTTTVGSNTAFGAGNITTGNAGLDSSTAVTLANNFSVLGTLVIGGTSYLTLNGVLNGAGGSLIKNSAGTLTLNGSNNFAAGLLLNAGTLAVGQHGSLGSGNLTIGGASTLTAANNGVALSNDIQVDSVLTIGGANNLSLTGVVNGAGQLVKSGTGTLILGGGSNTFTGGVALSGGTLVLGNNNALGTAALVTSGTATVDLNTVGILSNALTVNGDTTLVVNNQMSQLYGLFSGSGNLTKAGIEEWYVQGTNTFTGNINLANGIITTGSANALGNPTNVNLGSGTTLNMNGNSSLGGLTGSGLLFIGNGTNVAVGGSNTDGVFSGALQGDGTLNKVGAGVLTYTGTSLLSSNLSVSGGTLKVDGSISKSGAPGTVTVNSGGTLTGSGAVNLTTTILNGGHLTGTSGTTLTLGSTILNHNSNIDVALGSPLTGNTPLFDVDGNLTLDGVLNITDAGAFGNGIYRLFDYSGSLTYNILDYGLLPSNLISTELTLQTAAPNQVNLIVASPNLVIQFWDGANNIADGAISGGTGVWNGTNTNWASQDGNSNSIWDNQFAVFMGSAGTITVDGVQAVNGMQFMTDGYQLVSGTNGSLNVSNRNDGNFAVRVDPNVTANLDLNLNGSGTLQKVDTGTLVLNGNNGYTGGTLLSGGTLVVGSDSALGTGTLTTVTGTTLDSNTAVTLANNMAVTGQLTLPGSNDMTLNGNISGTGSLLKGGASRLTLGGTNSFTGPLALNAGSLVLASTGALGSATLNAANGTSLDNSLALSLSNSVDVAGNLTVLGSNDLTLTGLVNGAGRMVKQGVSRLALNGANGFTGGVDLQSGTLSLGNAGALGSGGLTVSGTSVLDTSSAMTLANAIQLTAGLSLTGTNDLTLNSLISGSGRLTKNGAARLTLNGANTGLNGGITVNGGNLIINGSLGSGTVDVGSGATLSGSGNLVGAVTIDDGGTLSLRSGTTLSVGSLVLNHASNLDTALGVAATGNPALLDVAGNVTLDGQLNVTDIGGFGAGVYRLMNYSGSLTDNGLALNTLPGSLQTGDVSLQTSVGNQINLMVGGTSNVLFWNGSQTTGNGSINGGSGTWNSTGTNWTNVTGNLNESWNGTFAVFQGAGGIITVNGTQSITGLQFAGDGYTLEGCSCSQLLTAGTTNIRVDSGNTATIDVSVKGTGDLHKLDNGTLILSGNNSYTGTTTVNGGTLAVNGSIASSSVLVNSGGTLGGSGTVGAVSVASGGTLAPGNSIGTLTVDGNLNFASSSTYRVEADAAGNSDKVIVNGTATLAGNVAAVAANGNYAADTTYTVLQANALAGQFDGVSSSLAFLDPSLSQDANHVYLKLARNDVAYADVANTRNQRNVAAALQNLPSPSADMNTIITAINNLSAEQARAAYDSIGGAGLTGMQRSGVGFSNNFGNQLMSRLQTIGMSRTAQSINGMQLAASDRINDLMPALARNTVSDASPSAFSLGGGMPVDAGRRGFWLRGFGSDQDTSGDGNAAGSRVQGVGISAGFDARVRDDLVVGVAFSHSDADVRASFAETGETRSSAVAVYASYANGPWTVNGNLMLAHNANEMDRNIAVGTLVRTAHARFDSKTVSAYGEVSYDLPQASWTLQPLAGLAVLHNRNDGFTETGAGALNIQADAQSVTSTRTLFGARALLDFDGISVQPRAIWAHEFGDVNKGMTAQFQGAPAASFTTYGVDLPRDSLIAGITVAGRAGNGLSLFADVQGEFNSRQTGLALLVGLRKSW